MSVEGNIKVFDVKGQGLFAIVMVKKLQFLQLMTNLSKIEIKLAK